MTDPGVSKHEPEQKIEAKAQRSGRQAPIFAKESKQPKSESGATKIYQQRVADLEEELEVIYKEMGRVLGARDELRLKRQAQSDSVNFFL